MSELNVEVGHIDRALLSIDGGLDGEHENRLAASVLATGIGTWAVTSLVLDGLIDIDPRDLELQKEERELRAEMNALYKGSMAHVNRGDVERAIDSQVLADRNARDIEAIEGEYSDSYPFGFSLETTQQIEGGAPIVSAIMAAFAFGAVAKRRANVVRRRHEEASASR